MRGKLLILKTTEDGCIIPLSHNLNQDGYFRYRDPRYTGKGRAPLIMYHRYVWEKQHGDIPDGYEIDHLCHNRACCNIDHLQCIEISKHKVRHNSTRYKKRKEEAKEYWLQTNVTGTELGEKFGVSFSCGCRWIREWKSVETIRKE